MNIILYLAFDFNLVMDLTVDSTVGSTVDVACE